MTYLYLTFPSNFKFNHLLAIFPCMAQNLLLTWLEPLGNEFSWTGTEAYPSSCSDGGKNLLFPTSFGGIHWEPTFLLIRASVTSTWLGHLLWLFRVSRKKWSQDVETVKKLQYPHQWFPAFPFLLFDLRKYKQNKNPQALVCQQPLRSGISGFESPIRGVSYLLLVINPPSSLRLTSSEARLLGRLLHWTRVRVRGTVWDIFFCSVGSFVLRRGI